MLRIALTIKHVTFVTFYYVEVRNHKLRLRPYASQVVAEQLIRDRCIWPVIALGHRNLMTMLPFMSKQRASVVQFSTCVHDHESCVLSISTLTLTYT